MAKFYVRNPEAQPTRKNSKIETYLQLTRSRLMAEIQTLRASRSIFRPNLSGCDLKWLRKIKEDKTIVIKPADKNLGVTVWSTDLYRKEAESQLTDTRFYEPLGTNDEVPTHDIREKVKLLAYQFKNQMEEEHVTWLENECSKEMKLPKFYLLPKVHKDPIVGRPIVAAHSWIPAKLGVIVDDILQQTVLPSMSNVLRDTLSLVRALEQLSVDMKTANDQSSGENRKLWLITADIRSLYTNIPTRDGLAALEKELERAKMPKAKQRFILAAQQLILEHCYFEFDGRAYRQKDGAAMGSPDSPTYANIVVGHWERALTIEFQAEIQLYKRLIDDVLTILLATQNVLEKFLNRLRNMHPALTFTVTVSEDCANFMDLTIYKGKRFASEGKFDLKPYEKPANLYLYVPYSSAQPRSLRRAWIKAEALRNLRNSSDQTEFESALKRMEQRLTARGYPRQFVTEQLRRVSYSDRSRLLNNEHDRKQATELNENSKDVIFFKTPFNRAFEQIQLGRILRAHWNRDLQMLTNAEPMICYRKPQTIANLVQRRDL